MVSLLSHVQYISFLSSVFLSHLFSQSRIRIDKSINKFVYENLRISRVCRPMARASKRKWDGYVCGGLVLDARIWSNLPLDFQLKLLDYLPLPALLRFQVVCKVWYEAIRSIKQVTAHGDCYLAVVAGEFESLRVYSSLDWGTLHVEKPEWTQQRFLNGATGGGLVYIDGDGDGDEWLWNIFTEEVVVIPPPPITGLREFAHVLDGDYHDAGEFTIIRVLGDGRGRWMFVYEWNWETSPLQLPAGEEFSLSLGLPHATIHGSILYFLTVNLQTLGLSVRSIDFRGNVDATSAKVVSFPCLPPCYAMYQYESQHIPGPYGRRFVGDIALAGGKLFIACMRLLDPASPPLATLALFACDPKQGKTWEFASEMPLTKGFLGWRPGSQFVELQGRGDMLLVSNFRRLFACLYNTSTKAWSVLGGGDTDPGIISVYPLTLSMRS